MNDFERRKEIALALANAIDISTRPILPKREKLKLSHKVYTSLTGRVWQRYHAAHPPTAEDMARRADAEAERKRHFDINVARWKFALSCAASVGAVSKHPRKTLQHFLEGYFGNFSVTRECIVCLNSQYVSPRHRCAGGRVVVFAEGKKYRSDGSELLEALGWDFQRILLQLSDS